jgi:hypothetical protein
MSNDTKKAPAGTVRVRVRSRGKDVFAWAGEAWTRDWREFDAAPAHVDDLRKAPAGYLAVEWPEGYKFADGSSPVNPTEPQPGEVGDITSAAVVDRHVREAHQFRDRAIAAERELNDLRLESAGQIEHTRIERDEAIAALRRVEADLQASEKARVEALALAAKADGATATAIANAKAEAAAAIDTAKAEATATVTKVRADCDALLAAAQDEILKITAERDAMAKSAAAKSGGKKNGDG